jgi:hypothetical protein
LKHSGFGIASFVLSLVVGVGLFAAMAIAVGLTIDNPGGVDETSPLVAMVGFLFLFGMFLCVVAIVLGFVGVLQRDRKKVFAILGIVFNALIIMGTVGLIVVGLAVQANQVQGGF